MIFKQKGHWLSSREFVIEQNGVKVIARSLTGVSKKFFDFHHIGKEVIHKKERGWFSLTLSILLFGYGAWLFYETYQGGDYMSRAIGCIIMSLLIFSIFFFIGQKYMYLRSERYKSSLRFLDNNPTEEELLNFISYIQKAQRIRLQQLYLTIDENMSYEEYRNNIQWLWDNGFLSKQEAEQRLGEVNSSFT